ncbi:MAG: alanine racemase [Gemmatimonadota bacterium]|nr:alanine racemase [Gemmatimonadota bacterium]MDH3479538.1 alanine racemase [Gemmatimonadota bacterium]MDH3568730.1 alanine racemase [Gemmatimonadota bacterium]MDH5549731.1 alanine racemase [Gemmatimonadota bacterium]
MPDRLTARPPDRLIDDCLSTRNGHLFIEQCDTTELVSRFGSPLFVISEDQLRRNVRRFQAAFASGWPDGPVKVLPAAKANWIAAVQHILASDGCGCDVYSAGELTVALQAGFEPQYISVNGVPKDDEHIYRCVHEGVRITIDSVEEVDAIERAATALDRVATVRLRLKPALAGFVRHSEFVAEGLVPTDIAALAYKGGLAFDDAVAVGRRLLAMEHVELVGFHQHHGRHHRSLRYWEEQMRAFAAEIARVGEALGGYRPREIDIGGGFAIPRDPFNAVTNYTEPLQLAVLHTLSKGLRVVGRRGRYGVLRQLVDLFASKPNATPAPSIEDYARVCTETLRDALHRVGIATEGLLLELEPGRSIHGDAGIHLTTVRSIKRMTHPIRFNLVVVDSTEFWLTGGRYEHHLHDYVFANKTDAPLEDKADIIGRSCFGDRLMPLVRIPQVEVGDLLALLDTGAYQEVSTSNFNALPRPATALVTGDRAVIIRRAETETDVLCRDVLPEHLGGG